MEVLRIPLHEDVVDKYSKQAKAQVKELESVLSHQLFRFADVDSIKPIILDDQERQHLEKLLARNFTLGTELVSAIQRALSVSVDGIEISLSPQLLAKLKSRAIHTEFQPFMQMLVKRLLEEYVGLR